MIVLVQCVNCRSLMKETYRKSSIVKEPYRKSSIMDGVFQEIQGFVDAKRSEVTKKSNSGRFIATDKKEKKILPELHSYKTESVGLSSSNSPNEKRKILKLHVDDISSGEHSSDSKISDDSDNSDNSDGSSSDVYPNPNIEDEKKLDDFFESSTPEAKSKIPHNSNSSNHTTNVLRNNNKKGGSLHGNNSTHELIRSNNNTKGSSLHGNNSTHELFRSKKQHP